ncbi:hypothetical protein LUZ60_000882 [Juncus effusus]|nr:hypothetical protein LUZ60_000882 [Juncus effusus]
MPAMALHLKLRSHHSSFLSARLLSTSSPFPPPPPPSNSSDDASEESQSQQPPSFSFSPSPPRRIPLDPPPPPSLSEPSAVTLEELRTSLASFRLRSPAPSSSSNISFQQLLKSNTPNSPPDSDPKPFSFHNFNSIRESLRQSPGRNDHVNLNSLQVSLRSRIAEGASNPSSIFGSKDPLPDSIFGKEARNLKKEEEEEEDQDSSLRTLFIRSYSESELGEKLRKLRPNETEKKEFSLTEMNERLAKLRKLEEESSSGFLSGIRSSLENIAQDDRRKSAKSMRLFASIGGVMTPSFMLKPPQEELLEKYFHPDCMSSAEKLKLELQKVRNEFKMSESDCGSARVQVATLTTKIKHLSGLLHKKDKHSRKGLQEMVQKRKKLLKYLRRTDWDSYCLVLSKLGLRDVPEYKAPDYKSKNKMKA